MDMPKVLHSKIESGVMWLQGKFLNHTATSACLHPSNKYQEKKSTGKIG